MNDLVKDFCTSAALLTRIKIPASLQHTDKPIAASAWAFPFIGLAVGALGGVVLFALERNGIAPPVATLLAMATIMCITGAIHEDGLADTADGFFGGRTTEEKLAIMKDSRIGTYGVLALLMAVLLRLSLISDMNLPKAIACIVMAQCISKSAMVCLMFLLPLARREGLAVHTGKPDGVVTCTALIVAVAAAVFYLGKLFLWPIAAAALAVFLVRALANKHIGGYTGDVLGTTAILAEIAVLLSVQFRL